MTSKTFPATKLLSAQRIELAIQAMADAANISHLADQNDVSRKFVYQQRNKAQDALDSAFAQTTAHRSLISKVSSEDWKPKTPKIVRRPSF